MKKLAIIILILLFTLGCTNTKEAIVDENLVCLPTDDLASLDQIVPGLTDETNVEIIEEPVEEVSSIPIDPATEKVFNEGDLVKLTPAVRDEDGDIIILTYTSPLNERGEWQTKMGDAGEYKVTITASDGKASTTKEVLLIIQSVNKAPVIEKITDLVINEGSLASVSPNIVDPDGDTVTISYSSPLDNNGQWQTDYNDEGEYQVTITASDGLLETEQFIKLTVNNVNRAPVLEPIEHISVTEGELVTLETKTSDPDNDELTTSYTTPIDEDGEWQTTEDDEGSYVTTVTVSDGQLEASRTVSIIVNAMNNAPVITGLNDITVTETETVKLTSTVTDEEGDKVTVTYSSPLNNNGEWTTTYDDAGEYQVTITATDGELTTTKTIKITVEDKNRAPEFVI